MKRILLSLTIICLLVGCAGTKGKNGAGSVIGTLFDQAINYKNSSSVLVAKESNGTGLSKEERKEKARRELHESNAVDTMVEEKAEWIQKNFEVSLKKLDAAYSELSLASKLSPRVKAKQQLIREIQSKILEEWAEQLVADGKADYDVQKYDLAISKLEKALALRPAKKDFLITKVDKYREDKAESYYKGSITAGQADPGKAVRDLDDKILYEQGKLLMQNQRYDEARAKFEMMLRINPSNAKAIAELRKLKLRQ